MPDDQNQNSNDNSNNQTPDVTEQLTALTEKYKGKEFVDLLDPIYKEDPTIKLFNNPSDLAKSYVEARKRLSASLLIPTEKTTEEDRKSFYTQLEGVEGIVRIPDAAADPEGFKSLYKKLGAPESAEGYKLDPIEGTDLTLEVANKLKLEAFELGLTQAQLEKQVTARTANNKTDSDNFDLYKQENLEQLRKAWGTSFDTRMFGAEKAIEHYSEQHPSFAEKLSPQLRHNAGFLFAMSELASALSEGSSPKVAIPQYGQSIGDLQTEIDKCAVHPAYFNPDHPEHKNIVNRSNMLYEKLAKVSGE